METQACAADTISSVKQWKTEINERDGHCAAETATAEGLSAYQGAKTRDHSRRWKINADQELTNQGAIK